LPVDQDFDDYPRRMYEIMEILEKAEKRSQLDILSDLITKWNNVSLQGVVMQIQHSAKDIGSGRVILLGVVVDKLRKIHTHLSEPDYTLAIKAYQEHLPIICNGNLIKEDNVFILKNPHGFTWDEFWKN
jgi:hypothetical protein